MGEAWAERHWGDNVPYSSAYTTVEERALYKMDDSSLRQRGKKRAYSKTSVVNESKRLKNEGNEDKRNPLLKAFLVLWNVVQTLVKVSLLALVGVYLVLVVIMYSSPAARELIIYLHPLKNPFENTSNPREFGLDTTVNFYISGPVGKLGAWFVPAAHISVQPDGRGISDIHLKEGSPVILYFHGNAFTRGASHRVQLYKVLSSLGYHVIPFDYRGFADSDGTPSEQGLIDDGLAAWSWVKSKTGEAPVYIWGHSLGSGVAGGVAKALCDQGEAPEGVILEAPFNNIWEGAVQHPMTTPFYFLPYFNETVLDEVKEVFRTDKRLADVSCPILILHDRTDDIISFRLGHKLYEEAKAARPHDAKPIKFVEFNGFGHKFISRSEKLPSVVREFVRKDQ